MKIDIEQERRLRKGFKLECHCRSLDTILFGADLADLAPSVEGRFPIVGISLFCGLLEPCKQGTCNVDR